MMAQSWGAPPMALMTVGTGTPAPYAAGDAVFALLYGVPVWGFAMLWLAEFGCAHGERADLRRVNHVLARQAGNVRA